MNPIDNDLNPPSRLRANLPTAPTSFVGRHRESGQVSRLLQSSRLVTLTGAAGCGKTRLALHVGQDVHRHYADGVQWVDLSHLADAALVSQAVAKVLHVPEEPGRTTVEGLQDVLRDKYLLLVLDNCEHVLRAAAELVEVLLAATQVSILATSREPLRVSGEMRYPLSPLSLPRLPLATDDLDEFDAVHLFVERSRAVLPDFALTNDNRAVVATICHQLDGLPLAIELVSTRVNVLAVEQIAARLDDRLELPVVSSHLTRSHHRTLRAAIDWSYDLLATPEQILLRRLSVFSGGWSLAIAEGVCAGNGIEREQILGLLSALVNKSLVVAQTLQRDEARYSLLETIRQYAHEKLVAANELALLSDRHLQCLLQVAEETEPKLGGPYQQLWLDWLAREHPNIRSALTWSLERHHTEAGLRIVNALYQYWTIRDYVEEGFAWVDRLLREADDQIAPVIRAKAVAYAALLAGFRGKTAEQMRYGHEGAALAEASGEEGKPALVWALGALAHAARAAGEYETEFGIARRYIQLRRELGHTYYLALSLSLYSPTAMILGRYEEAHAMLDEALPLLRQAGDPYRIALALNYSGDLARCEQQYVQAQVTYEASASLLREIGAARDLASVLHNWGHACLHVGDADRAGALFGESMALQQAQRNTPGLAECLIGFAALAVVRGLPAPAARLLAAAEAIGGPRIASAWAATRKEYEHYLARARASLTETAFRAEESIGRALSPEQAVMCAQSLALMAAQPAGTGPDELTVRERHVAALIAQSKSNAQIADELVVSKRTVEKHIEHILSKLGFTHRAQIVRWATELGLVKASAS